MAIEVLFNFVHLPTSDGNDIGGFKDKIPCVIFHLGGVLLNHSCSSMVIFNGLSEIFKLIIRVFRDN